ncbi:MAG: DUF1428 domain-containing protein [Akkermansiaceae bacterium]|nr:DUF1428 domain-containing protein [Akkermansiaceae bacterium]
MSNYIDGFLLPLSKDKLNEYSAMADKAGDIWKEYGALAYWECVADDLEVKDMISFKQSANAGPDDTVIFAWAVFKSREHRDEVNAKIFADPRLQNMCDHANPPFDHHKMAYGGFRTLVKK